MFLLLSTHSIDPCLWGECDHPAFGPPASLSLNLASRFITPAGFVHKSRGENVVLCGGGVCSILLLPPVARCLETIYVYI